MHMPASRSPIPYKERAILLEPFSLPELEEGHPQKIFLPPPLIDRYREILFDHEMTFKVLFAALFIWWTSKIPIFSCGMFIALSI